MTTFVLIHGAWHGGWCWEPLQRELRARGVAGVAMDLPAGEPLAGFDAYMEVIHTAVDSPLDGEVVVVGHSLGGLVAPVAADALDADAVVYLAAFVPVPGLSFEQQVNDTGGAMFSDTWAGLAARQCREPDGSTWWRPTDATEAFFHDCDSSVAAGAAARLRPQHWGITTEPCPLASDAVRPAAMILGRQDRAVSAAWARRTSFERLGRAAMELPGGHSPMLARPAALADALLAVTGALLGDGPSQTPANLQRSIAR